MYKRQAIDNIDPKDLINIGLEIEKECKNYNENVVNIRGCKVIYSKGDIQISNTKGLDLKNKENILYTYVVPVLEIDGQKQDGTGYKIATNIDEINPRKIAKMGVDEASVSYTHLDVYKRQVYINPKFLDILFNSTFCNKFNTVGVFIKKTSREIFKYFKS